MRKGPQSPSRSPVPLLGILCAFLSFAPAATACTIPVFRYALERWTASRYEVILFTNGQPSPAESAAIDQWSRSQVNVEFRTVDASLRMGDADAAIWKSQQTTQLPWAVVRYPDAGEKAPALWAGKFTPAQFAQVLQSPARSEIARRLIAGESGVWVLLESGDKPKDDHLAAQVDAELKRLAGSLKLPEIAADGPQLRSSLPLKVSFSILRVSRADPLEASLVQMLRNVEPEYAGSADALIIPVVGRGRAVSAILGANVNPDRLGAFAEFICGQCSCEVKELNPGIDLLIGANWDVIFDEAALALVKAETPRPGASVPIPSTADPLPIKAGGYIEPTPATASVSNRWLMAAIGAACAIALMSGAAVLRGRRK